MSQELHLSELPFRRQVLDRNSFLKVENTVDTNIYLVESGSLKVFFWDEGEEQIVRFGYKDNVLVALDSYLTGKPSVLCIQAIKKTTVRIISKAELLKAGKDLAFYHWWAAVLEDLVLQQMEREIDILTQSPKERYTRVLQRSPRLFQEIPLRYIANYLRMSPETLSRLKNLDLDQAV